MRLRVIATDYDRTIANDGILNPAVRSAIAKARARGVLVVLVTGRILPELKRVTGGLEFVDGVVAENGAVVALPSGHVSLLGAPPPICLIEHLTKRGINFKVGRCVVEMDAEFADVAISLIREMQLPLSITFNRNRMMLLPGSISKATGLHHLLNTLGVSVHNAIGIGDAENDHELLARCEHGVAVSWGSQRLQAMADHVITGDGPSAVAEYIDRVSADVRLPASSNSPCKVILEETEGQAPLEIVIGGRNLLIAGDSKSGKSWITGLIVEQQILQGYTVYVIDPEGDYCSLTTLPNSVMLGGGRLLPYGDDLKMLLQQGINVILNLSHLDYDQKCEYVQQHCPLIAQHRRERGFPHRILLDECHYFLSGTPEAPLLDSELAGYTLVTYRPSQVAPEVLKSVEIVIVTRLAEHQEVDILRELQDNKSGHYIGSHQWHEQLAKLGLTQAAILPPTAEAHGALRQFVVAPRITTHVRHRTKYFDSPVSKAHEFVFTFQGRPVGESAGTLRELAAAAQRVETTSLINHSHCHDFSRWIAALFFDYELANLVWQLESELKNGGDRETFVAGLQEVIETRYGNK